MTTDYSQPLTELRFTADERTIGLRIDAALAKLLPHRSRTFFRDRAKNGAVFLNDRPARPSLTIREGDTFVVRVDVSPSWVDPDTIPIDVMLERDDLVVVNKHPGVFIHPTGAVQGGTLLNALHARHNRSGQPPDRRPQVVHRLDADTSGVVVFAKGPDAAAHYGQVFEGRRSVKIYLALVEGRLTGTLHCEEPLGDHDEHPVHVRQWVRPDGKPAQTVIHPLAHDTDSTLVAVRIRSGRLHQIRVHAAFLGHPVCGDLLYNPADEDFGHWIEHRPAQRRDNRPPRQMLHAWSLTLPTPRGEPLSLVAPPPKDFQQWCPAEPEKLQALAREALKEQ